MRPSTPLLATLLVTLLAAGACACTTSPHKLSAAECEDRWTKVERTVSGFDAAHDRCARSEDCIKVRNGACLWGCGTPLARSAAAEREALDSRLRADECASWTTGGCEQTTPKPVPSCAAWEPVCEQGRCRVGPH